MGLQGKRVYPIEFDHHTFLNDDSQLPALKPLDGITHAPDRQVSQLPLQPPLVLLILYILCTDVNHKFTHARRCHQMSES